MRLLLIEDDQLFADSLLSFLRPKYTVDHTRFVRDGEYRATVTDYDVIVLAHQLPDGFGSHLCARLRALEIRTPILLLTGHPNLVSVVDALNAGADDYLLKPVRFEELQARIQALMRRSSEQQPTMELRCADLELDLTTESVKRGGKLIALRRKEYQLLEFLMRHKGQVCRREVLLEHLWGSSAKTLNTVDAQIKLLRQKVDKPFKKPLIHTIHGSGFRLDHHSPK